MMVAALSSIWSLKKKKTMKKIGAKKKSDYAAKKKRNDRKERKGKVSIQKVKTNNQNSLRKGVWHDRERARRQ